MAVSARVVLFLGGVDMHRIHRALGATDASSTGRTVLRLPFGELRRHLGVLSNESLLSNVA
jgi:hypothetical protein